MEHNMKRTITALISVLSVLLMLCACTSGADNAASSTNPETTQLVSETATTQVTVTHTQTSTDATATSAIAVMGQTTVAPKQTEASDLTSAGSAPTTAAQVTQPAARVCSLSVRCDTILDNLDSLDKSKRSLVPSDGVLLNVEKAEIRDGDTAIDILLRETKSRKMHMEYSGVGDTAYIEGIGNLYEFDCGSLSGWKYKVNGKFPGIGCGGYVLSPSDSVEFLYTCDLGNDIGIGE